MGLFLDFSSFLSALLKDRTISTQKEDRAGLVPTTFNTKFTHLQLAVPSGLNTPTLQGREEQTFPRKWISFWYEPFRDYIHFNLGRDPRLTSLLLLTQLCLQKPSAQFYILFGKVSTVLHCAQGQRDRKGRSLWGSVAAVAKSSSPRTPRHTPLVSSVCHS